MTYIRACHTSQVPPTLVERPNGEQWPIHSTSAKFAVAPDRVPWASSRVAVHPLFRALQVPHDFAIRPVTESILTQGAHLLTLGERFSYIKKSAADETTFVGGRQLCGDEAHFLVYSIKRALTDAKGYHLRASLSVCSVVEDRPQYCSITGIELRETEQAQVRLDVRQGRNDDQLVADYRWKTRSRFEGRGLTLGLSLLSNAVLEDLITRYPEIFRNNVVEAHIHDLARAQSSRQLIRTGFSSDIASYLGFDMSATAGKWIRQIQTPVLDGI